MPIRPPRNSEAEPQPAQASFADPGNGRRGGLSTRIPHGKHLLALWDALKTSFWFVPSVMSLGSFAFIWAAHSYDAVLIEKGGETPWFVYVSTPDNAREILSTILSSMITMASLVFSITMVVLSLAANQFGPRLIRSFMASPQTQFVLGTFVMTIVYCLITLTSIGTRARTGELPYTSVSVAVALTLLSVAFLVFFLHSLARSIVSETVIERVAVELDGLLENLQPFRKREAGVRKLPRFEDLDSSAAYVEPQKHGYVQAIEFGQILDAACEHDVLVVLAFRAGDYLGEHGRSIAIVPADKSNDDLARTLRDAIVIGKLRTPVQDPEASVLFLVEIATRALSSGTNDPFTAAAVIDRLSVSLAKLFTRELPTGVHRDRRGEIRVVSRMPGHADFLQLAFDEIRQNGAGKPMVVHHILDALARVADVTRDDRLLAHLKAMLQSISEASDTRIEDSADRRDIAQHIHALRQQLDMKTTEREHR